jgi:hypothetical protein
MGQRTDKTTPGSADMAAADEANGEPGALDDSGETPRGADRGNRKPPVGAAQAAKNREEEPPA